MTLLNELLFDHDAQLNEFIALVTETPREQSKDAIASAIRLLSARATTLRSIHRRLGRKVESKPILEAVCREFNVTLDQLRSTTHRWEVATARQVVLWLCRKAGWVSEDAGKLVNRERSNTSYAVSAIEARRQTEPKFKDRTDELCASLGIR